MEEEKKKSKTERTDVCECGDHRKDERSMIDPSRIQAIRERRLSGSPPYNSLLSRWKALPMTADPAREHIRALLNAAGQGSGSLAAFGDGLGPLDIFDKARAYLNTPELPGGDEPGSISPILVDGGSHYVAPEHGWTCYHCGETFPNTHRGWQTAGYHFGWTSDRQPACRIAQEEGGLPKRLRAYEDGQKRDEKTIADLRSLLAKQSEDMADIRDKIVTAFDLGFAWQSQLRGQNIEDSRAVGRTLLSDMFTDAGLEINVRDWDSFTTADIAICEGKRRIKAALIDPKTGEG